MQSKIKKENKKMRPEQLARLTIEKHIKNELDLKIPEKLIDVNIKKAGSFVSIKTHDNDLRGCIGTILATRNSVIEEIMANAVSSATRDPRFPPVEEFELNNLKYSVDILHEPERVKSLEELDPKNYGIIVSSESQKQALLLPDLEGLDTVEKQIIACMKKAGIDMHEKISVQRFKVDRYSE